MGEKMNKKFIFQTNSNLDIQPGYPFSFEECVQMSSQDGDIWVSMFGHEVDWISTKEPRGEYILTGTDRNGDPQWKYVGNGTTQFIGSVFTFGFLENREEGGMVSYGATSWEEFDSVRLSKGVNYMGHKSTADLCKMAMKRISIKVSPGDKIYWAQYDGPRLEEGSTTLPDDARLIPMKAVCHTPLEVKAMNIALEKLKSQKKYDLCNVRNDLINCKGCNFCGKFD